MRRIVQVIAVQTQSTDASEWLIHEYKLYALCDDGTLWTQHYGDVPGEWRHVPTDVITRTEVAYGTQAKA